MKPLNLNKTTTITKKLILINIITIDYYRHHYQVEIELSSLSRYQKTHNLDLIDVIILVLLILTANNNKIQIK